MTVHQGGATRVTTRVASSDIVSVAMRRIESAQHTIEATMDIAEEVKHPLPGSYFDMLHSKMNAGVVVHRIGFGSQRDFLCIKQNMPTHMRYIFRLCTATDTYRRMLLIDRSFLLYALETKKGRRYYYTTNQQKIDAYLFYFEHVCQ